MCATICGPSGLHLLRAEYQTWWAAPPSYRKLPSRLALPREPTESIRWHMTASRSSGSELANAFCPNCFKYFYCIFQSPFILFLLPYAFLNPPILRPSRHFSTTYNTMASAATFYDLKPLDSKGQAYNFDDLKGKVVLIVNVASK